MYSVYCPVEGAEVLRGPRSILSLHTTSEGITGYFRCHCGTLGVFTTGRGSRETVYYHPTRKEALASHEPVPAATA